jgi:Na+-translocating ferredoxin:NAD+ oxidoreductase RNF subunit RnfB
MGVPNTAVDKNKLKSILNGWKNYFFEDAEVEKLAKQRAEKCAGCPKAVKRWYAEVIDDEMKDVQGLVCTGCDGNIKCPLSTKLRSRQEKCPENLWLC